MKFTLSKDTFSSPWNGLDKVTFHVTEAPPNTSLTFVFPTHIITGSGGGQGEEGINNANTMTDANGNLDFNFNGDPNAIYLQSTITNGWVLPDGSYKFGVREFSVTPPKWTYVSFQKVGAAQTVQGKKKTH